MMDHGSAPIYTERLLLRTFTEDDIEALFAIYRDEEVNTFLPWFPLRTLEEAERLYREQYAGAAYRYGICRKTDGVPIGYVHVSTEDGHDLGYGLRKEFWHQGIVTEACQAVLERARGDGFLYLTATHDSNNPRSGDVMKRLGMRYQYSYEELWQPKNQRVIFRLYQINLDGQDDRVYRAYWDRAQVRWVENDI